MTTLGFNKVCELEDFGNPDLVEVMRDVCAHKMAHFSPEYPKGVEHRKDWEVAMAVRSLREFGALRPDATILGVGAGTEDTLFWLTRHVKQVFASDRYLSAGAWEPLAPLSMLVEPKEVAPFDFDERRLVAQHMDGRALRYPDDTFDGIFSSGSIEHFGLMEDVAAAAYEMGRVLKPGGVLALSTELRISGPPGGIGWENLTLLFSGENLRRYIVEATGLEPVDPLRLDVSDATMATPRDLTLALSDHLARAGVPGATEFAEWDFPHLVLVQGGYVFGSVHLTLRKGERYPAVPNAWARPSERILASVREYNRSLLKGASGAVPPGPAPTETTAPATPTPAPVAAADWEAQVDDNDRRVGAIGKVDRTVRKTLTGLIAASETVDRQLLDVDRARREADDALATILGLQPELAGRRLPSGLADPELLRARISNSGAEGWMCSLVTLPEGPQFRVMVDPSVEDPVAGTLAKGVSDDQGVIGLMLRLVKPGELVLDVGAHLGSFSLAACAAGRKAVAVEAWPPKVELLRASAARNGFGHHQLRVVNAAAADAPGTVEFCGGGPWGHLATGTDDVPAVTVPAVTLDDLLYALGTDTPSLVKIDVEGSEISAIRGMRRLLEQPSAPPLLCQSNGHTLAFYGVTPNDLLAELEGFGYRAYLVEPGRLVRVRSDEMQPGTLVDYLAVKRAPTSLQGWRVDPAMQLGERVSRIVADCTHTNPDHRAYMARALQDADPAVAAEPAVADALAVLRRDPVPAVREAAAWSARALGAEAR